MNKKNNKKGFTLAELLIVVAIIAVLVAIAIPIFTKQLERSREATDLSNIRAAYAEAVSDYLADGSTTAKTATVTTIKQQTSGWLIEGGSPTLKTRIDGAEADIEIPDIVKGDTVKVNVAANGTVTVTK
ncbi:MAG: prepilin-type N-terminal cleavage/methylation domain-containing protein [Eubacterium sp.]|nr:prepilin-type N-terminal cleavage/methylation domain-containing protein [Eubacterium sp.]